MKLLPPFGVNLTGKRLLLAVLLLTIGALDLFAQDVEVSLRHRRRWDQIHVEVWMKALTANAPAVGNASFVVSYNSNFLTPAVVQSPGATDSIDYNVDQANPVISITSPFDNNNGYSALGAQAYGPPSAGLFSLELTMPTLGVDGFRPSSEGKGTFVGKLIFDITNAGALTSTTFTGVQWNTGTLGDIVVFGNTGTNIENQFSFVNPGNFTIQGITVLNPNGPGEVVDRDYLYPSVQGGTNGGYPIYFERSALTIVSGSVAAGGTSATAYALEYSLNGGASFTEFGRVAETTTTTVSVDVVSGDISTNATVNTITTLNGGLLNSTDAVRGVLRTIWATNSSFAFRSEDARLRIRRLSSTTTPNITSRTASSTVLDASDQSFVLGRLFFTQLNGTSQYFRSQGNFSNPTQLTAEAWVNLNSINGAGSEPAIIASSAGPGGVEGQWMLYLHDGKFPAFRAREIENRGNGYVGILVSPDSLGTASAASPLGNAHSMNWRHIAATVANDTLTLFVDGEIVNRSTNKSFSNIRMGVDKQLTNHPIWIGINPNGTVDPTDYLNAGIKGVRVWRTALTQDEIRTRIAGISDPSDVSGVQNRALEIMWTLEGTRNDAANEVFFQNAADTIQFVESGVISNVSTRFRPDRPHLKLTSPTGGEGVSNLQARPFEVRWVGYGLNGGTSATVKIEFSTNGGSAWVTTASAASTFNYTTTTNSVLLGDGQATWNAFFNPTVSTIANYSVPAILKIQGETGGDTNFVSVSGQFTIAPHFSLLRDANSLIIAPNGSAFNISGQTAFLEAWIRPHRFPTDQEEFFPIVAKVDSVSGNEYYSLGLLPDGRLRFRLTDTQGQQRVAVSDSSYLVIKPNTVSIDSAWTHVGVFINLGNGGTSEIKFYIDGVLQSASAVATQLGTSLTVSISDQSPFFIGYYPSTTTASSKGFIGQLRQVRYWNGTPGGSATSGSEPTALTQFIWGVQAVEASELNSTADDNLVASFSLDGLSFVNGGITRSIPSSNPLIRARFYGGSTRYAATRPVVKVVEPVFNQRVTADDTDVRVRWVGFNYVTTGTGTASTTGTLEYSTLGGGGLVLQPYKHIPAAAVNYSAGAAYRFPGVANGRQFAISLNASTANPDNAGQPLSAVLTNARLRYTSTTPTVIHDYSNIDSVRSESRVFSIVPQSNFTVRALLEGYHDGNLNTAAPTDFRNIASSYDAGGLKITLFTDNLGTPGDRVDSAQSENQYQNFPFAGGTLTARSDGTITTTGTQFANIPFVFTSLPDGNYWVVVEHPNHFPVMSRYAAPFLYNGDDQATYGIESGWDFQTWNGVQNNVLTTAATIRTNEAAGWLQTWQTNGWFSAYGSGNTAVNVTQATLPGYSQTALIFNNGVNGTSGTVGSSTAVASFVGGDVVRDGQINAADRNQVRLDEGTSLVRSDVTGDGTVNSTDRTIVDRNFGKVTSLLDLAVTSRKLGNSDLAQHLSYISEANPMTVISELDPARSAMFNEDARFADETRGTELPGPSSKLRENNQLLSSGFSYTVDASTALVDNRFVDVDVYITNKGADWAMGNATFAVNYQSKHLSFVEMRKSQNVRWDNNSSVGYSQLKYAPRGVVANQLPDVVSIEVDFDARGGFNGIAVPSQRTYVGTLRFELKSPSAPAIFKWFRSTAVHTADGRLITGNGDFVDITPIITAGVLITAPNGGETIMGGQPSTITWDNNEAEAIKLQLSVNNGGTWVDISGILDASTGRHSWTAPKLETSNALVRALHAETGVELDRSDSRFTIALPDHIITRPSAEDPIYVSGRNDRIEFKAKNIANVRFEFSSNGGSSWTTVGNGAAVPSTNGFVSWRIPTANTKNAVVRMIDASNNQELARSSQFKILAGTVAFVAPRAAERIDPAAGEKQVRWTVSNVTLFDMQFSANGGASWTTVQRDVDATRRMLMWNVPNVRTERGLLRAIYNGDEDLEYSRTDEFAIDGTTGVGENVDGIAVSQLWPNPSRDRSSLSITLPSTALVSVEVVNAIGERVLVPQTSTMMFQGTHDVNLDVKGLPSGSYLVRTTVGTTSFVRTLIVVQ